MKLSVQFPLKTVSENATRSLPFAVARVAMKRGPKAANGLAIAIAQRVRKQREQVRLILASQLPRPPRIIYRALPRGRAAMSSSSNTYRVRLVRISAGKLDSDGLEGALKAVRDEVAAWLGIDDGPGGPATWAVANEKGPAKYYGVRVEIEDDAAGPDVHRLVGDRPAHRQASAKAARRAAHETVPPRFGDCPAGLRHPGRRCLHRADSASAHDPAPIRRSYAILLEDQDGSDEWVLRELAFEPSTRPAVRQDPPLEIRLWGRSLCRRPAFDTNPTLGEHWIYEEAPGVTPTRSRG